MRHMRILEYIVTSIFITHMTCFDSMGNYSLINKQEDEHLHTPVCLGTHLVRQAPHYSQRMIPQMVPKSRILRQFFLPKVSCYVVFQNFQEF